MNRRNFIKLMAAGVTPLAVSVLCNLPLETLVSSPTARSIFTPTKLPPSATPTIGPVPYPALGSHNNYHLHSSCNSVTGLSVTIDITQDIISDIGFSFQLNCYSPQGANCGWQQYCFVFTTSDNSPLKAGLFVDNWGSASFKQSLNLPAGGDLINHGEAMLTLPSAALPAGYKLMINLQYDEKDNVNGATFIIVDNAGKTTSKDIMLESLTYDSKAKMPVTIDGLAPIYAFELDLVGPINAKNSYLSSGAGTITYTASSPLYVANKDPQCTASRSTITAEAGNSVYAPLFAGPSQTITQSFGIEIPNPYRPGNRFAVSQQFGRNQTDLFAIDSAGQLGVFYILENGHWHSSKPIGAVGLARPDAAVAASQHFGVEDRTDVFLFDQNRKLNVFWIVGNGDWNGPLAIGSKVDADPNAGKIIASQRFGIDNQTDVFMVDTKGSGQLNVISAIGSGNWKEPEPIGSQGLLKSTASIAVSQHFGVDNQTDVFVVDLNGQLNVFSVIGSGKWSGPQTIGPSGFASTDAAVTASARFGTNNQTDVYVVDTKGQLNVFSAVGSGNWSGPQKIGSSGLASSGAVVAVSQGLGTNDQTDVFLVDKNGQLNVFSVDNSGQWSDPVKVGPQNVAPSGAPLVASQQFGVPNQTDVFVINQTGSQTGASGQGWPTVFWSTSPNQWNGPKELVHDI